MKIRLICLFVLLLFLFTNSQVVQSSCAAKGNVLKLYKNDADRLSIRRVNQLNTADKDSVRINKDISRDYLSALAAVYNATILPAADTVGRLLNIHAYNPGLNSLVVLADSNLVWMTDLRENIFPTRDYELNQTINRYHLVKVFYSGLLQPSMVVFKTDTNSNLAPLAKRMKTYLGVKSAESEYLYGDGNDITDSITPHYTQLIYSYGWQECPTGCELRRYWKFRIYSDCSVEYLGSYGSMLEASLLLNVLENEQLFSDVKIYANPIKNKLYVEYNSKQPKDLSITVENKKGEIVYIVKKLVSSQELDLILLSSGTYYLKLQDDARQKVFKVIKR